MNMWHCQYTFDLSTKYTAQNCHKCNHRPLSPACLYTLTYYRLIQGSRLQLKGFLMCELNLVASVWVTEKHCRLSSDICPESSQFHSSTASLSAAQAEGKRERERERGRGLGSKVLVSFGLASNPNPLLIQKFSINARVINNFHWDLHKLFV